MPLAAARVKPRLPRAWLSFDGVDDYVSVSDSSSLRVSTGKITLAAWIKPLRVDTNQYIISKFSESTAVGYALLLHKSGKLWFLCGNGTPQNVIGGAALSANEWCYVAATADGSTIKLYINGSETYSAGQTQPIGVNTYDLHIARRAVTTGLYFIGIIGEICIYSRALAESEIRHNYYRWGSPVKDGLVLWLAEDTINPPTWNDKSGYGNHGTIYGAIKVERPYEAARVNSAARVLAAVR